MGPTVSPSPAWRVCVVVMIGDGVTGARVGACSSGHRVCFYCEIFEGGMEDKIRVGTRVSED